MSIIIQHTLFTAASYHINSSLNFKSKVLCKTFIISLVAFPLKIRFKNSHVHLKNQKKEYMKFILSELLFNL